ncbi:TPA: hypothetical protein ACGBUC_005976 [Klebsiella variicola]|uniref:hypothetical protein n=1 Tax=Klebsiella variicola TaxID=244366 RepID=UPI0014039389|nr:hypothetical protein [Klebsiella variicola]
MKKLFIALVLLAPVAAQSNVYSLNCAGVNLSLTDTKDQFTLIKGHDLYVFTGGVDETTQTSVSVFNRYLQNVKTSPDSIIPVDAQDHLTLMQTGVDGSATFHLLDSRGNHFCSVNSFKAGE